MTSTPYLRPLPQKNAFNQPLWDAAKRREFVVPKCDDCGDWNWTPYPACRTCLSEQQTWTPVSGRGTLMTYSIVHRGPAAFGREPYVTALMELEERPRSLVVLGNIIDVPDGEIEIGMPLKIIFEDIPGEDVTLWRFTKA